MNNHYDLVILGGGINGCGVAADAAIRNLSVLLIEKDDLAGKTSSSSSKLIHGGLRYLEYYDFSLVRKSLHERQLLVNLAPYLVRPTPFVLPYQAGMRPTWMLRAGLFLYDHLSRNNRLPTSKLIKRRKKEPLFSPLANQYYKGFLYYDCATDDSRLTITNALQAKRYGATIRTYSQLINSKVIQGIWHLTYQTRDGQLHHCQTKCLINAAGPWVKEVNEALSIPNHYQLALVKGSHIVVPKLYEGEHAYLLQNTDKRVIFIVPYHGYSMIGTTDLAVNEAKEPIIISPEEIDYLLNAVNAYLRTPLTRQSICSTWSGIRPLIAEEQEKPQAISRDYALEFSNTPAPAMTIYGGKITTYRQLAKEVVNALKSVFPHLKPSLTSKTPLPGSTHDAITYRIYEQLAPKKYPWIAAPLLKRLLSSYGTNMEQILSFCKDKADMGLHFGQGLYQVEVDYLIREEWAIHPEDILWRRTKLGLRFTEEETERLAEYMKAFYDQSVGWTDKPSIDVNDYQKG